MHLFSTGASKSDTEALARRQAAMLKRGIHLAPSQFACTLVSPAHDGDAIDQTLSAAAEAVKEV